MLWMYLVALEYSSWIHEASAIPSTMPGADKAPESESVVTCVLYLESCIRLYIAEYPIRNTRYRESNIQPARGLPASGGFIRLWWVYPPLVGLPASGGFTRLGWVYPPRVGLPASGGRASLEPSVSFQLIIL